LNGCGKSVETVKVEVNPAIGEIKAGLNEIAESGEISISADDIRSNVGNLTGDGAAKKVELMTDLDELTGLTDSAQIKAKAKEMIPAHTQPMAVFRII
jgi:hypothetical protein